MELVITAEHLNEALAAGACESRVDAYNPGQPIDEVNQEDLIWFLLACPTTAKEIEAVAGLPLWALSKSGYGYGYGYSGGYGYGHGCGGGYGHGCGYGYSCANGSGCGSGSGYG